MGVICHHDGAEEGKTTFQCLGHSRLEILATAEECEHEFGEEGQEEDYWSTLEFEDENGNALEEEKKKEQLEWLEKHLPRSSIPEMDWFTAAQLGEVDIMNDWLDATPDYRAVLNSQDT